MCSFVLFSFSRLTKMCLFPQSTWFVVVHILCSYPNIFSKRLKPGASLIGDKFFTQVNFHLSKGPL